MRPALLAVLLMPFLSACGDRGDAAGVEPTLITTVTTVCGVTGPRNAISAAPTPISCGPDGQPLADLGASCKASAPTVTPQPTDGLVLSACVRGLETAATCPSVMPPPPAAGRVVPDACLRTSPAPDPQVLDGTVFSGQQLLAQQLGQLKGTLTLVRGLAPDAALDVVQPGRDGARARAECGPEALSVPDAGCARARAMGSWTVVDDLFGRYEVQSRLADLSAQGRTVVQLRARDVVDGSFALWRGGKLVRSFRYSYGGLSEPRGTALREERQLGAVAYDGPVDSLVRFAEQVVGVPLDANQLDEDLSLVFAFRA